MKKGSDTLTFGHSSRLGCGDRAFVSITQSTISVEIQNSASGNTSAAAFLLRPGTEIAAYGPIYNGKHDVAPGGYDHKTICGGVGNDPSFSVIRYD